jgi:nucleoside-diphosphate-sugar epimerase
MKIGILGCGYVGQACAVYWRNKNHFVSATTRQLEKVSFLQETANKIYLLQSHSLPTFLKSQEILLISVAPSFSDTYQTTYSNTIRNLKNCLPNAPLLRQIIYTSSTSVYGDHHGEWVDEHTMTNPLTENHLILEQAEKELMALASSERKICIFRLGEIYGPNRSIKERIIRFHKQSYPGTGNSYTNLTHLTDIIRALDFAIEKELSGIYNLCNDYHVPRQSLYQKICEQAALPCVQWDPAKSTPHSGNKKVSNQKIKKAGFTFLEADYKE